MADFSPRAIATQNIALSRSPYHPDGAGNLRPFAGTR